jgi:RNA polymerase sigma-70 factor (ECF subfamily)
MQDNDKKLIHNFLRGDEAAFALLMKIYLKPIYNFLYQLSGDFSAIDDLTQETFVKVWKNRRRFDEKKSFKTWIFTIAKNTAYDYFKKKKTIPFSRFLDEDGNNKLENVAEQSILPDEILARKDIAQELEKKLKEIPEKYRLLLTLHYKEDFSLTEISQILKIPYNTIKSNHGRALKALKERFRESRPD